MRESARGLGPLTLVEVDHATSAGEGRMNEDLAGSSPARAWMIDGATDLPATFRPAPGETGAYWLASELDRLLRAESTALSNDDTLGALATAVGRALRRAGMSGSALPPACSIGLATVIGNELQASIVGDVTIYHLELDDLLSDDRFGRNEKRAVRTAGAINGADAIDGIEDRRRRYISGGGGQWVLADNPAVRRGARSKRWLAGVGGHLLMATDGFARAVSPYGLYSDWRALAADLRTRGADEVMRLLREHEARNLGQDEFFKSSDDACVALYRLVNS